MKEKSKSSALESEVQSAQNQKHTPGPWRIKIFSQHGPLSSKTIRGSDGQGFATTCGLPEPLDTNNATLIAVAPELLELLIAMRDEFYPGASGGNDYHDAWEVFGERIEAAIVEAEGR
jgi:hypothetical protein